MILRTNECSQVAVCWLPSIECHPPAKGQYSLPPLQQGLEYTVYLAYAVSSSFDVAFYYDSSSWTGAFMVVVTDTQGIDTALLKIKYICVPIKDA